MPKSNNQKGKILYLERILRETGEDRTVTMQEILSELMKYGVTAERKSIYDDIEVLRSFGMDVKYRRGRPGGYYLAGQKAPERMEMDSREAEAQEQAKREEPRQGEPQREESRQGEPQREEPRQGEPQREEPRQEELRQEEPRPDENAEAGRQESTVPGMLRGLAPELRREDMRTLKLVCGSSVRKAVQDYFGDLAQYKDKGTGYFTVSVQAPETPRFYGWLAAMGHEVRIAKPKKAAQAYRDYLKGLVKDYKGI